MKLPFGELTGKSVAFGRTFHFRGAAVGRRQSLERHQALARPALHAVEVLAIEDDAEDRNADAACRRDGCLVTGRFDGICIGADLANF
jgi:hypothetical protein